jgi:hypothetical protein
LCIKRIIHKNHQPRFKKLGRRCKQHWKIISSPRSAFKKKNKVEEGRAFDSRMKRE